MENLLAEKQTETTTLQTAVPTVNGNWSGSDIVFRHILKRKFPLLAIVAIGITTSLISFLLTLIIGDFFILQFHTSSSKGKLLEFLGINISSIVSFFGVIAFLIVLKLVTQFLEKFRSLIEGEKLVKNVREILFSAQVNSEEEFFNQRPAGQYLLRYSNDLKSIQLFLTKGLLASTRDVFFIGMGICLLVLLNVRLGLFVVSYILVSFLLMTFISRFQKSRIMKSRSRRSLLLAYVTKNFHRFSRMKKNADENRIILGFNNRSKDLYNANIETSYFESLIDAVSYFLHFLMIGFVLLLIADSFIVIRVSDALSCILLLMLMQGAIRRIFKSPSYINKGLLSIKKIQTLINPTTFVEKPVITDTQHA